MPLTPRQLMRFTIFVCVLVIFSCNHSETKNSNTTFKGKNLNLDSLLFSEDTTQIIITIDNFINSSLTSGDDLSHLTESQKNFYYIQELEREVNNGGFNQYFYNSGGDYAHQTISALNAIGANKASKILQSAINEFPNHQVPKDRASRQSLLSKIEKEAQIKWDKLDEEFYKYPDDLSRLNIIYIKKNQKDFE